MVALARELSLTPIATEFGSVQLSRSRLCRLFNISRSAFYRGYHRRRFVTDAAVLRSMRKILKVHRRYGYRPMTRALRKPRRGQLVNGKRVLRIMRENGLLNKPPKKQRWRRSKSGIAPYPNLAKQLEVVRPNQLWRSDFTEIRVRSSRVFIAVVCDEFGATCIGWNVHTNHSLELTLPALRMALMSRRPKAGFIHHSDQGSEYMAYEYTDMVEDHGGIVSASRRATPTDNASCERFIKTLKNEELDDVLFTGVSEVESAVARFVKRYNGSRLHSRLGYRSPAEFERMYYAALEAKS